MTKSKLIRWFYRMLNIVILLLLVHQTAIQAQNGSTSIKYQQKIKTWQVGVEFGFSKNQIRPFSPLPDTIYHLVRSKTGIAVGGFLSYRFNEYLSLKSSLWYSTKGVNYGLSEASEYFSNDKIQAIFELAYLEMPITAQLSLPIKKTRYSIFSGISPAYAISKNIIFSNIRFSSMTKRYEIISWKEKWNAANPIDVSLLIGASVGIMTKNDHEMLISLRFSQGLMDVSNMASCSRNDGMIFTLGFGF